jgi:hypothetical protein
MVVAVKLRHIKMRLKNEKFLDPTYSKKSSNKFVW